MGQEINNGSGHRVKWWDRRPVGRRGSKLEGLGDVVEVAASGLGVKKCAGCEKRRQRLNRLGKKRRRQGKA